MFHKIQMILVMKTAVSNNRYCHCMVTCKITLTFQKLTVLKTEKLEARRQTFKNVVHLKENILKLISQYI